MNRFIIADPQKCIGCRTCEIACVMAHSASQDLSRLNATTFTPRLHVIKSVNLSTPVLCRQCEDAPCANVCPNGAIVRSGDAVQVMQEHCIGCKTCVVACPYGAMEVVVKPLFRQNAAAMTASQIKPKRINAICARAVQKAQPVRKSVRPKPCLPLTAIGSRK